MKAPDEELAVKPTEKDKPADPEDPPAQIAPVIAANGDATKAESVAAPPVMAGALQDEPKPADGPESSEYTDAPAPEKPDEVLAERPPAPVPTPVAPNGDSAHEDSEMKDAPAAGPVESVTIPTVGDKRKVEEAPAANGDVAPVPKETDVEEPPAKKAKAAAAATDTAESITATTNGGGVKKSNSRAKRPKKAAVPVGQTLRKTRSQGPVES